MKAITSFIAAAVLLATVLVAPAGAQHDDQRPEPAPDVAAEPARPMPERPIEPTPTPEPEPEALRLDCNGRINDHGRAAIACEWSSAEAERAAGYVLERVTEAADPVLIVALRGLDVTTHIDPDIGLDTLYGYRVKALSETGTVVGISEWDRAIVETPEIDVEVLSLDCHGRVVATDDGRHKVGHCEWRPATHEYARGYQLWRIVDDEYREMVWSGGLDTTSHADRLPNSTMHARYAVLAVNADGEIVGQSRPNAVRFPAPTLRIFERNVRVR